MTEMKTFGEMNVLRFIGDAPDRSAYCLEGVSGDDLARYFAEKFGASDVEVYDLLEKLQEADLVRMQHHGWSCRVDRAGPEVLERVAPERLTVAMVLLPRRDTF